MRNIFRNFPGFAYLCAAWSDYPMDQGEVANAINRPLEKR